jgi:transposase InsO family protein
MKFTIEKMCRVFMISKSGYYAWLKSGPSKRWQENEELLIWIKNIYEVSRKAYGSPRVARELLAGGKKVSQQRVARIMRAAGIRARKPRKFVATTDSRHNYPVAPNLLNRNFTATRKCQYWVSDITYVRTKSGWLYLTVVIDLYDRKVIGWSMSHGLTAGETIIPAWRMAVRNRPITQNLIFHSDRGVQYACEAFTNILKNNTLIERSMSRKGNCWDNAVAESFFKTIKVEWIYNFEYADQNQAMLSIFDWIESWYNRTRRHSALGYNTIEEFERINSNFKNAA